MAERGRRGRKPIWEGIARRLRADLERGDQAWLPSIADLARRYLVSKHTMLRAARDLRERGFLVFEARQRMRVAGREAEDRSAVGAFYARLRRSIEDTEYRAGMELPKVGHFTRELGISNATALAALRRLEAEGLAHRRGKRWIAGGADLPGRVNVPGTQGKVLLMLLNKPDEWKELLSPRTAAFASAFTAEAEKWGIEIQPVFTREAAAPAGHNLWGLEAIRAFARSLGLRYLGMLIPLSRPLLPDLKDWVSAFEGLGKPVVWFDRHNDPGALGNRRQGAPRRGRGQARNPVIRCYFDEGQGVALALDALARAGHRDILYTDSAGLDWTERRMHLIQGLAQARTPPLRIRRAMSDDRNWAENVAAFPRSLHFMLRHGSPRARAKVEAYLRHSPELEKRLAGLDAVRLPAMDLIGRLTDGPGQLRDSGQYLRAILMTPFFEVVFARRDFSAVIVPNDSYCELIFHWLEARGVAVPGELSMVSFDNDWQHRLLPVDSVDFGFGYLGYAALHAFLDDVPLRRDAWGDIPARPHISHRGSVGAPAPKAPDAGDGARKALAPKSRG